ELDADAFDVAEDEQQWLHDSFLDVTGPACPDHSAHPLWLDDHDDPKWTCGTTGRAVCRLGELSGRAGAVRTG
ncbi:MAG: hypothetical protein M3326_05970, partial [Actinomycetota bacterium]|nr:hypothetical protein [Actinomycetota bacterium]